LVYLLYVRGVTLLSNPRSVKGYALVTARIPDR